MVVDEGEPLVVDACVAINIRATGRWKDVFSGAGWRPVMTTTALREVLYLLDDAGEKQHVALDPEEVAGYLEARDLTEVQTAMMLRLVPLLGPGEASSLAVATSELRAFATDDQAARNHEITGGLRVVSTTDLIRSWADGMPEKVGVREAVGRIDARARFRPGAADPNHAWWLAQL
jgi:hypothetical protein